MNKKNIIGLTVGLVSVAALGAMSIRAEVARHKAVMELLDTKMELWKYKTKEEMEQLMKDREEKKEDNNE